MRNPGRSKAGIVELMTSAEAASGMPWWWTVLMIGAGCAAIIVIVVGVRRFNSRDPLWNAFIKMANGLGLSRRERRIVSVMGSRVGVPPAALLFNPEAMRSAAQGEEERKQVSELLFKIGS